MRTVSVLLALNIGVALSYRAGNSISWAHEIKINFTLGRLTARATLRLSLRVFDDKITAIKRPSNAITAPVLSLVRMNSGTDALQREKTARTREFCSSRGERTPVRTPWRYFPQLNRSWELMDRAGVKKKRMCAYLRAGRAHANFTADTIKLAAAKRVRFCVFPAGHFLSHQLFLCLNHFLSCVEFFKKSQVLLLYQN